MDFRRRGILTHLVGLAIDRIVLSKFLFIKHLPPLCPRS
jgi:hypothetical protein